MADAPSLVENRVTLTLPEAQEISYVVIREDITEGQRIRGFRILADGRPIYESACIGHKRIIPCKGLIAGDLAGEVALEITAQAGEAVVRDIAVY
jgi:hypothetical protein